MKAHSNDDLQTTFQNILNYKKYCDSLNISFIFMPMPEKETVYYNFVPFDKQPDYLFRLNSLLKIKNVRTINTLKIYNNYTRCNKDLLFRPDDCHWNSNATELMSEEIIKEIKLIQHTKN